MRKKTQRPNRVSVFEKDKLHTNMVSWGLGLQSTAMIHKILDGELPRPDCIIFADPHYEREGSYENLERMRPLIEAACIPFHIVSAGNIRDDEMDSDAANKYPRIPYFGNASRYETIEGKLKLHLSDTKKAFYKAKRQQAAGSRQQAAARDAF